MTRARLVSLLLTVGGASAGVALALAAIAAQYAEMLETRGWVCASDYPGMILLYGTLGGTAGWFASTKLQKRIAQPSGTANPEARD